MVGRMGKQLKHGNNLFVSGKNRLEDFERIIKEFNRDSTLIVDTKDLEKITLFALSDHYHFMEKGIPSFLLSTGLHDDYHKPTDTAEKLSYDKMVKIIQLAYDAIKHFADEVDPW
jgi:Zn-dependent M28 family amino/carboxypeptidase